MGTSKRIVCLANSRKHGRFCIAGIEVGWKGELLGWIRPIGMSEDGALYLNDMRCQDGGEPRLLDIVQVPLFRHFPKPHQPENWAIESGRRWSRQGRIDFAAIASRAAQEQAHWETGYSTQRGLNDRLPLERANAQKCSLRLVSVDNIQVNVGTYTRDTGERVRRMLASLELDGAPHRLWITDRSAEAHFLAKPDGDYTIENAILTLSLGEPVKGWCYKLIAGVLIPPADSGAKSTDEVAP